MRNNKWHATNDVVSLTKQCTIVNLNWDESTTNSKGVFSFYYDPVMDRGDKKNMDFFISNSIFSHCHCWIGVHVIE